MSDSKFPEANPSQPIPVETPAQASETGSDPSLSRRAFLGTLAVGAVALSTGCSGFPTIVPRHVVGGKGFLPPSQRIRLAGIGVGSKGTHGLNELKSQCDIIAICDADTAAFKRMDDAGKGFPDARRYQNYEEMLDAEAKNIDAVQVATPDHLHAHASLAAISHGLHVFCEKPLCHNYHEVDVVARAAKEAGVVTILGTQGHAGEGARLVHEWIDQGAIGNPTEVLYFTDRPIWPQGMKRPAPQEVLSTLDWNRWLGPAQRRPFNEAYHPFAWRGWCDFGTGALGDNGAHAMDTAWWALGLTEPTRVEIQSSGCNGDSWPEWTILIMDFPATAKRGPIKVRWYDGKKQPPNPPELAAEGRKLPDDIGGQIIIGDEGKIMAGCYADSPRLIPEAAMKKWMATKPKELYPRAREHSHFNQFVDAVHGNRDPLMADFAYAAGITKMLHIGNLAVRFGQNIEWDAKTGRVTNHEEANKFLTRKYRWGWKV